MAARERDRQRASQFVPDLNEIITEEENIRRTVSIRRTVIKKNSVNFETSKILYYELIEN